MTGYTYNPHLHFQVYVYTGCNIWNDFETIEIKKLRICFKLVLNKVRKFIFSLLPFERSNKNFFPLLAYRNKFCFYNEVSSQILG